MESSRTFPQPWHSIMMPVIQHSSAPGLEQQDLAIVSQRLAAEKGLLEDSLADCVTYLEVLRKKLGRLEHRLYGNTTLTRKKRKQLQQSIREVSKDIRNRDQDEQALLTNLQACKANLYIVGTLSCPPATPLSAMPEASSRSTQCSITGESEPTEYSWHGWTDDMALSPFQRQCTKSLILGEIAPDDCSPRYEENDNVGLKRPPLALRTGDSINHPLLFAPPNTAASPLVHPLLSPKAAVFVPLEQSLTRFQQDDAVSKDTPRNDPSFSPRCASQDGVDKVLEKLSLRPTSAVNGRHSYTWCNSTPERSPKTSTFGTVSQRGRTTSF